MDNIFERKDTFKLFIELSIPLVCSTVISMIYNIADTYFISYAQDTALVAGVSLCAPLTTIMMALGNLLAQGGCSLVSRLIGKGDHDAVRRVTSYCFYMSLILGVILAVVLLVLRVPILYLMGAEESTLTPAMPYYTVISIAAPIIVMNYVPSNILRSEGLAKQTMYASLLGTVVNLILDPLMIIVLHMSSFGAALATVIGYGVTAAYYFYIIKAKSRFFSIRPSDMHCEKTHVKEIYQIGVSSAMMNILMSLSQIVLNQSLLTYGSDKIAAMGIALKIYNVLLMVCVSFAFGAQPVLGYMYGSRQWKRLYHFIHQWGVFMLAIGVSGTVILMSLAGVLVPCFLKDEGVVTAGILMLRWQSNSLVCTAVMLMASIIFQAFGKAKLAFVMSFSRQGILLIAVLLILQYFWGYMGIVRSQTVSNIITAIIGVISMLYVWKHRPADASDS